MRTTRHDRAAPDGSATEAVQRFGSVEFPRALVTAHAEGNVVFFVGAGASMSPPTGLPNFKQLAADIAELTGYDRDDARIDEPDTFLGRLDDDPAVDVHRLVAQEIERRTERNATHEALARLASVDREVRLVTTNYDDHLRSALRALGREPQVYSAPAMPDGGDFSGLIHLHGWIKEPRQRMVVTDTDFGKAYLTRGWATTFLRDLFKQYVVCFVGYSHDDRMMDYLAKGLPSDTQPRYVLTDEVDPSKWERLRIRPITFPTSQYSVITQALTAWADQVGTSIHGRAQRIRELPAAPPPELSDDHDFLLASLDDQHLVNEVCRLAISPEWVTWMLGTGRVQALSTTELRSPGADRIALWVAENGANSQHAATLRGAVSASSATAPALVAAVLGRLAREPWESSEERSAWLHWVISRVGSSGATRLALERLWSSRAALPWADTLLLADAVLDRWTPGLADSHGAVGSPRLAGTFRIARAVSSRLSPADATQAHGLLIWLSSYLEQAHRRLTESDRFIRDPWSDERASIAPAGNDRKRRTAAPDALIDVARDALTLLQAQAPDLEQAVLTLWVRSPAPVLRRLAVHHWAGAGDVAAAVSTLIKHKMLLDVPVLREVRALLVVAAPVLSEADLASLVGALSEARASGLDDDDRDSGRSPRRDQRVYDLLDRLDKARQHPVITAAMSELKRDRPGVIAGRPEFFDDLQVVDESLEDEWPCSPEALHRHIEHDPITAVALIGQDKPASDPTDLWWPGGDLLRRTIESWPHDGVRVWPAAEPDLRARIVTAWRRNVLPPDLIEPILGQLATDDLAVIAVPVARLLGASSSPTPTNPWAPVAEARGLASRVLDALARPETPPTRRSDLEIAAQLDGHAALASFWLAVAAVELGADAEECAGLPELVARPLEQLLSSTAQAPLVLTVLLSELRWFERIDPDWARTHLLPTLDLERGMQAVEPLWQVALQRAGDHWSTFGLLDKMVTLGSQVSVDSGLADVLVHGAAAYALNDVAPVGDRLSWLTRFLGRATTGLSVLWITHIAHALDQLDDVARALHWERWMFTYLERRVAGSPKSLTDLEITALVRWIGRIPVGGDMHRAVNLLLHTEIGLATGAPGALLNVDIPTCSVKQWPQEWARLLAGLLAHTSTPGEDLDWWIDEAFEEIDLSNVDVAVTSAISDHRYRLLGR